MDIVYSHRNGETEIPTEKGFYWAYNEYGSGLPPSIFIRHLNNNGWDNLVAINFKGQKFYGPIPMPQWRKHNG